MTTLSITDHRNRNRNKFINQIRAPGEHMQLTIGGGENKHVNWVIHRQSARGTKS